jgi:hypothetical protein
MTTVLIILGLASAISATIVLCACFGASREFDDEMRANRRTDEDHERARYLWRKTSKRIGK